MIFLTSFFKRLFHTHIRNRPIGSSVFLPHASNVEEAILNSRPFPLHSLIGIAISFGDNVSWRDKAILAVPGIQNFKDFSGSVVEPFIYFQF